MRTNLHAGRTMKISPHFVRGAGEPGPHYAGLCWTGRPALSPLIDYHLKTTQNIINYVVKNSG